MVEEQNEAVSNEVNRLKATEHKDPKVGLWELAKELPGGQQLALIGIAGGIFFLGGTVQYFLDNSRIERVETEKAGLNNELESLQRNLEDSSNALKLEKGRNQNIERELGLLKASPISSESTLMRSLEQLEPDIFNGADTYSVARLLVNQNDLHSNTSFSEEIGNAVHTFDMFANTAGFVVNTFQQDIEKALERGVHVRILLSDYTPENATNNQIFASSVGEDRLTADGNVINAHRRFNSLIEKVKENRATFDGSLEIRWHRRLMLYTSWVRDANSKEAIGHLGTHLFTAKAYWPAVRFSKRNSPELVEALHDEFEQIWKESAENRISPPPPL